MKMPLQRLSVTKSHD
uniref:Uncharacterized protein n=1 Tax=Arundo donax TaxID=35708 RepID=A0A0A9B156_ARUDO